MSTGPDLKRKIEAVLAEAGARREARQSEVRLEMSRLEERLARFEQLAACWMEEWIVPRLQTLATAFPNSLPVVRTTPAYAAVLAFQPTEEFPVDARVEASVSLDVGAERIRLAFQASIIPILMDYEREGVLEYGLGAPDTAALGTFLDERIVRFVRDYQRVREPDSPYQKDRMVTDPVCGMRLRRADAAASLEHEGRRFWFCVPECRDRFAADPGRFTEGAWPPGPKAPGATRA